MSGKESIQDRVSDVLFTWLRTETQTSATDHNKVLDDYAAARQELRLPFAEAGISAAKQRSHYSRYQGVLAVLPEVAMDTDRAAERFRGSVVHHALMFVSGGFRLQNMLQARDADAYNRRRRYEGRAAGVNIPGLVYEVFGKAEEHGLRGVDCVERFVDYGNGLNETILAAHGNIYGQTIYEGVGVTDPSLSVRSARAAQEAGIRLAAGSIIMLANLSGDNYEAVPFLTPQSVTTAGTYYPLTA
ncbi:MAG TPA: hypothetical protein VGO07_01280 [Candidatus Saccharimonadales bacterium]|jgi:hypothetical protein|nr:hypothetical protein [Candidatus Saccharimonadales bacterium]